MHKTQWETVLRKKLNGEELCWSHNSKFNLAKTWILESMNSPFSIHPKMTRQQGMILNQEKHLKKVFSEKNQQGLLNAFFAFNSGAWTDCIEDQSVDGKVPDLFQFIR